MTGLLGFRPGYRAIESCDVLLLLGTDFSYRQFYPSKGKIIQVDIRGENLGRRTPIDIGLVGNVKDTVQAILPMARPAASAQKPAHVGPRVERRPGLRIEALSG
jgi:pyruvate dehydrogenase (quinone)